MPFYRQHAAITILWTSLAIFSGLSSADNEECAITQLTGNYQLSNSGLNATANGTMVYVASAAGLSIIDMADATNPIFVSSIDTTWNANDIAIFENHAFLSVGLLGLDVINISDPVNPIFVTNIDTPGFSSGISISGPTAYLAGSSVFRIFDISDPSSPVIIGSYNTPGQANGIDTAGTTAYVADFSSLQIVDCTDPSSPQLLGSIPANGQQITFVKIDQNRAYIRSESASGISIYDISKPANPSLLGTFDPNASQSSSVDVRGNEMFVTTGNAFYITDISDPTSPKPLSMIESPLGQSYHRNYTYDAGKSIVLSTNRRFDVISFERIVCNADLTGDCLLNFFDVSLFLQLFSNNDPIADFTGDGEWNFFDVSAFLQNFSTGCP